MEWSSSSASEPARTARSTCSTSDGVAPQAPTGSCGCFLMQQVIVESPGRQSIVAACARSVGRFDVQYVPPEQVACALLAEQPDANSPQNRARPKNTEDVKCFIRPKLEQSLSETPRRALARETGRSRPLSGRSTRDMRNFLPPRSALLLVLLASVAMARGLGGKVASSRWRVPGRGYS